MPLKALRDARHQGVVAEIARVKMPFPDDANPDLETLVNIPTPLMATGQVNGKDFFPDIVVVRRPGTWLKLIAQVETADTITDESAINRWKPCADFGDFLLYVPSGSVPETKAMCKKHKIKVKGIRTWRFRPVWGLDVTEA
ncbi:hypothetical protein AYO38_06715 [bacterium SCGC AG-212-C10]|nr:hypothetical protein AYO38_06715 [bacterium SCGC AG-212-C10]